MHGLEDPGTNISVVINNLHTLKFFIGDCQFLLPWIMYIFSLSKVIFSAAQYQQYKH